MARVLFSRAARAHVENLNVRVGAAVLNSVTLLEGEPEIGKRLRGRLEGLWSLRVGSYRLIYEVRDNWKTVRVVAVLHRSMAYRSDPAKARNRTGR